MAMIVGGLIGLAIGTILTVVINKLILNRRQEEIMRAVVSVMLKGESAKKMLKARDVLEDMYGLSVSNTGRSVSGLPEDIDEAAEAYAEIRGALDEGSVEYI